MPVNYPSKANWAALTPLEPVLLEITDMTEQPTAEIDAWLDDFDLGWVPGAIQSYAARMPPGLDRNRSLVELVKIDIEREWMRGARPRVNDYLAAFPELAPITELHRELAQAEVAARDRYGGPRAPDQHQPHPNDGMSREFHSTLQPSGSQTSTPHGGRQDLPDPFGRYQHLTLLGSGAMGSVYRATDSELGRPVAIKVPHFEGGRERILRSRFRREARAAARVRHPNLVDVFDVGQIDGIDYLTMRYIEGNRLSDLLQDGPVTVERAVRWIRAMASGLAEAHRCGVIHRDLKPANVIIARDDTPVVIDYGLAVFHESGDVRLSHSGSLLGTPLYMAPEQVRGQLDQISPATDVWAIGVILYQCVTGVVPFTGGFDAVFQQILAHDPKVPSTLNPQVPDWLDRICWKALQKQSNRRFQTMSELVQSLDTHGSNCDAVGASNGVSSTRRRFLIGVSGTLVATLAIGTVIRELNKDGGGQDGIEGKQHTPINNGNAQNGAEEQPRTPIKRWQQMKQFQVGGTIKSLAVPVKHEQGVAWLRDPFRYGYTRTDADGKHLLDIEKRPDPRLVESVLLSPTDQLLVANYNNALTFWNMNTTPPTEGGLLNKEQGPGPLGHILIKAVEWNPTGSFLMVATAENKRPTYPGWLGRKDVIRGQQTPLKWDQVPLGSTPTCLAFNANGTRVAVGLASGQVELRDPQSQDYPIVARSIVSDVPSRVALLPDGQTVAILANGQLKLWRSNTASFTVIATKVNPNVLAVSTDGRYLVYRVDEKAIVRDMTLDAEEILDVPNGTLTAAIFGADSLTLFTGGSDGVVRTWVLQP